jgi:peptide/nickel transport system substrate-binding protein
LLNQGNKERENTLLILQDEWKKLGIEMKIRTVEWATFINEFVMKGQYDAVILAWNILEDPDISSVWHSSAIKQNGLNFVGFKNEEADMLLEKARSTAAREERKRYYDRFQEILHEEQPYLFLYVPYALPMVQKRFQGIEPAVSGITHNMEKWWIPSFLQ